MIGSLFGKLDYFEKNYLVLNVGGVGYKVFATTESLERIQKNSDQVKLFISTQVREDSFLLYGFLNLDDLKMFEQLLTVSGVGPKTALLIFEAGSSEEIKNAIMSNDVSFFTAVPRVGKRNAQRIIIDLKNKVGSLEDIAISFKDLKDYEDVAIALKSLGYNLREAHQVIKETLKDTQKQKLTTEELLRLCIKNFGK